MDSRRTFLKSLSGAAVGAAALAGWPAWAQTREQSSSINLPGQDGMIVRSLRFLDLETPIEDFNSWLTPASRFFVRNHMHEPVELNAEDWRMTVGGEVDKPGTFSLRELAKLPVHSVVNTLECAGNGRGLYRPQVPGIQWQKGAVGTASFSGPRLADGREKSCGGLVSRQGV